MTRGCLRVSGRLKNDSLETTRRNFNQPVAAVAAVKKSEIQLITYPTNLNYEILNYLWSFRSVWSASLHLIKSKYKFVSGLSCKFSLINKFLQIQLVVEPAAVKLARSKDVINFTSIFLCQKQLRCGTWKCNKNSSLYVPTRLTHDNVELPLHPVHYHE